MSWLTFLLPHPILFTIGGFSLYTHGLLFAVGAEVGLLVLYRYARKSGLLTENIFFNSVLIFAAGLLGARLGYFILYQDQFASAAELFAIWQGGLLSFTGIAAGLAAAYFLYKGENEETKRKWLDGIALATLLAWSIGRIGNYYAVESGGVLSPHWNAFYGRVPIQLLESLLCLVLFGVGWYVWTHRNPKPGKILLGSLLGYNVGRLFIDTWRDESMLGPLHLSQWVCLVVSCTLIVIILRTWRAKS